MNKDIYEIMDSPLGPLTIVARHDAVRGVYTKNHTPPHDCQKNNGHLPVLAKAIAQLQDYFAGKRHDFDLPLDPIGTPFQHRVWTALRTIPYGKTISYGELAALLGAPKSARAVGAANSKNPISIIIPCHRVIGVRGNLVGYAGGIDAKKWLITHENTKMTLKTSQGNQ